MTDPAFPRSLAEAEAFDARDPLRGLHAKFALPDGVTYLVGHSLGAAPHGALEFLQHTARADWATGLVGSWNSASWIDLPAQVGARIAGLIGAKPDEVIACDSVSVNLFKLVGALLQRGDVQNRIIVEAGEFPTDQYILEQLASVSGAQFQRAAPGGGPQALAGGGVLVRSLVDYRTAEVADVAAVEAAAQAAGAAVVWDLSHATGVLDLKLAELGARYAVGCTYKYLNGGPGAPAFIYVRGDAVHDLQPPLAGWLGHARPFAFEDMYEPASGVQRFVTGTPPILSMAALSASLDVFDGAALRDVEAKARHLGDMCLAFFAELGLRSASPPIGARRGGHVSVTHSDGYAVSRALDARGIKTDFRTPDTIRFGLSPLYLSYVQVWQMLETFAEILTSEVWREPRFSVRAKVT